MIARAANWMDGRHAAGATIRRMGRYKFTAYSTSATRAISSSGACNGKSSTVSGSSRIAIYPPRWPAIFASSRRMDGRRKERVPTGLHLFWRQGERRLLMLTARDPFDSSLQSFDPFKNNAAQ